MAHHIQLWTPENYKIVKAVLHEILDKSEQLREQLAGTAVADDIDQAVDAIAKKFHVALDPEA